MGLDRFIAFGHSVGGGMAAHCAAMYSSVCAALITESAQAFVESKTRSGIITDFHSVISGNSMLSETNHVSLLLAFQSFS
jgi:pimeloyl-ACP methyl ester carboxylesterase